MLNHLFCKTRIEQRKAERKERIEIPPQKRDAFNYGVHILRVILAFAVIMVHFPYGYSDKFYSIPLHNLMQCATPAFMFLSFLFMERHLSSPTFSSTKKRIVRLVWPFVIWGIATWVFFSAQKLFAGKEADGLQTLLWQLLTGHGYPISPLWYLAALIWITLLFSLLSFWLKEKAIFAFLSLGLLCLVLQYTGLNYNFFKLFSYRFYFSYGRIAEMIPYAALGYIFAYEKAHFGSCEKLRPYILVVLLFFSLAFFGIDRKSPAPGFHYSGLFLLIGTTCFASFFYLLPLQWLSEKQKKVLTFLGAHTLGIYCMHYPVGCLLRTLFRKCHININLFVLCILIYIFCFFLSHLISLLPYKMTKALVD